jgi:hypothetical protein
MRIRTIKPEFWRSDDIDQLCIEDRLLYIGLWSYVDDAGIGVDKDSAVAADLFAGDLAQDPQATLLRVRNGLLRLANAGLIQRYRVNMRPFLRVRKFADHQTINRPTPSRNPSPTSKNEDSEVVQEDSVNPPATLTLRNRGTGEQGDISTTLPPSGGGSARARGGAREGQTPAQFEEFWREYPRRKDKRAAIKAWNAAIKRGVPAHRLIDGAREYAKVCEYKDAQYVKYPATWINAGSYEDEAEPAPQTRAQQWLALANNHEPKAIE